MDTVQYILPRDISVLLTGENPFELKIGFLNEPSRIQETDHVGHQVDGLLSADL